MPAVERAFFVLVNSWPKFSESVTSTSYLPTKSVIARYEAIPKRQSSYADFSVQSGIASYLAMTTQVIIMKTSAFFIVYIKRNIYLPR